MANVMIIIINDHNYKFQYCSEIVNHQMCFQLVDQNKSTHWCIFTNTFGNLFFIKAFCLCYLFCHFQFVFFCALFQSNERTRQTELKMDVTIKIEGLYAYLLMSNFRLYFAFLCCELPVVLTSKKRQSVDFMSGWNLKDADFLFNLENIYYFPSCSGGTISLLRSFAPSLLRSFAPSLLRSFAPSLLHSISPSLLHSISPPLLHLFTSY